MWNTSLVKGISCSHCISKKVAILDEVQEEDSEGNIVLE